MDLIERVYVIKTRNIKDRLRKALDFLNSCWEKGCFERDLDEVEQMGDAEIVLLAEKMMAKSNI
jgi:hypothetical protein